MPKSPMSVIMCRVASIVIIVLAAVSLNVGSFTYKSVFVGLLFSHFFLGFYYSRRNIGQLRKKKYALGVASGVLLGGLYFAVKAPQFAPYFLVVHSALSDAYILQIRNRMKDAEHMRLLKSAFYTICFGLLFIGASSSSTVLLLGLCAVGLILLGAIAYYTEEKLNLTMFELPLVALVVFTKTQAITFDIHFLGFYHILTWYAFSFWMLVIKEKSPRKSVSFFSMVLGLSAVFIVIFEKVVGASITDTSFAKIIAFWSILHITSTISLSKFNPRVLKNVFYVAAKKA